MDPNSLSHHLIDGLKMLRQNGLKAIRNPINLFREYIKVARYRNTDSLIMSLDYSTEDLVKNQETMVHFRNMKDIEVKTIDWFIPYFIHAYAGVHTILRFADYFHSKKGIRNTLIFYGNPLASETEIKYKVLELFPNLLSEEIIVLRNHDLDVLPHADICIATHWVSAYLVLKFSKTKGKFYFIQDYEPLFYQAGTLSALAEATYRFGFYGIANTPGLYDIYTQGYNGIAEYFTPSVDSKIFYPSNKEPSMPSKEKPFTIFFYARSNRARNAFELGFAALRRIKKKYGDYVRIYTAGEKWNPQNYDLDEVVSDLGVLPYKETGSLYRNCDLGIVFMFTKHPSYLPFELMNCGCVVLTNYNPATAWFFKDGINCSLTEPSVSCVCEKIEMLISNPKLRKQMILNAQELVGKTSWDNEAEKIYRFICRHEKSQG
jgi:glycosyltransferase involved in cell wall biosynthesis